MKPILLTLISLCFALATLAQDYCDSHNAAMNKMQKERLEFIAKELNLNDIEKEYLDEYLRKIDIAKVKQLKETRTRQETLENKSSISQREFQDFIQFKFLKTTEYERYKKELLSELTWKISCEKALKIERCQRLFMKEFYHKNIKKLPR